MKFTGYLVGEQDGAAVVRREIFDETELAEVCHDASDGSVPDGPLGFVDASAMLRCAGGVLLRNEPGSTTTAWMEKFERGEALPIRDVLDLCRLLMCVLTVEDLQQAHSAHDPDDDSVPF